MNQLKGYTIFYTLGIILLCESCFLLSAAGVSLFYHEQAAITLGVSTMLTFGCGFAFWLIARKHKVPVNRRTGYFLVALIWLVMSFFGSLPYYLGYYVPNFTDAFFETISGFTTTGATIFTEVESLPRGILYWRSLTHFIGGIGIVVIVLSVIPFLGSSGISLFSAEVPGPSKDKFHPKLKNTAAILIKIYVSITLLCALSLYLSGIELFESVCTAFGTTSTGGFVIRNSGAAEFTAIQQYIIVLFMFTGGLNFTLIYRVLKGNGMSLRKNEEFKTYVGIIASFTIVIAAGLLVFNHADTIEQAFRNSLFQVVSIITTTGFISADYMLWYVPLWTMLFILMFSGAMSGSTSGGLKTVRYVVLFKNAKRIINSTLHLNTYAPIRLNGKVLDEQVLFNILSIFLLYVFTAISATFLLVCSGEEIVESLGTVASCLNGVGPGLGRSGGFGNCDFFMPSSKWILSMCMYLGRLEIASVFVLFSVSFRRK